MDVAGGRRALLWAGDRIATAIENGPTAAGIGSATSRGLGPVTITGHGFLIQDMDGSGFRALNGRRRGFTGVWAVAASDGFLVVRAA
jgi:hypothetical protein